MNRLNKIWSDLNNLKTDNQVLNYWDKKQTRILSEINYSTSELDATINILHKLAKTLNEKERYSAVFYLFTRGYQPIENKLTSTKVVNELKYELGRGLHHNRKYDYAKKLFNELAQTDFDTKRIDGWWEQTAFASTRDKIWIKIHLLPQIGQFVVVLIYLLTAIKLNEFVISTTIFITVYELYQSWCYQLRVKNYLKEFSDMTEIVQINKDYKKKY